MADAVSITGVPRTAYTLDVRHKDRHIARDPVTVSQPLSQALACRSWTPRGGTDG